MAGGLQDLAVARANLLTIPIGNLEEDPDNVRTKYGDIPELAASIALHGVKKPLVVRLNAEKKAVISDGHRRYRATQYAIKNLGLKIVGLPCISEARGTNEESRVVEMLVANEGQKPLEPIEEGQAYKRLLSMGWTQQKIAAETGKKLTYVKARLDLLAAPREVRQAVEEGRVSPGTAKALTRATPKAREAVLAKVNREAEAKESKSVARKDKVTAAVIRKAMGESRRITSLAEMHAIRDAARAQRDECGPTSPGQWNAWQGFLLACEVFTGEAKMEDVPKAMIQVGI